MRETDDSFPDYGALDLIPSVSEVLIERHRPKAFQIPFHHHASIEVNFLTECEMEYTFAGERVNVPKGRPTIFWGAIPHCVTDTRGSGETTNVYIGFSQILGWQLPDDFVNALIRGDILCSEKSDPVDDLLFRRWAKEKHIRDPAMQALLTGEVEMRLRRFALSNWVCLRQGGKDQTTQDATANHRRLVETMVRFVSNHYSQKIAVSDVADHANLSPSYAMSLFKKVLGTSIKEHIMRVRLGRAQMLLSTTDMKILNIAMDSGFGSLSSFYDAFNARLDMSPAVFRANARRNPH